MKCVCPMGGDRTCPDSCPLAVWANLPAADRKAQRKPVAEKLYQQGFTMDQIATQLGVTQQQISKDLASLQPSCKPPRPKGGRPKASKREKKPGVKQAQRSVNTTPENWDHFKRQALEQGYASAAEKLGELIAEPEIAREALSMTAQEKLDAAIRQHKHRLDLAFKQQVQDMVRQRVDEFVLPHWKKQIEEAKTLYERRKSLMDKETFNIIRRALHPDSRASISDKKLAEAFDTFMRLEKYLLNEKDSPTDFGGLPSSLAEWDKMRVKRTSGRSRSSVVRR